jgi:hypothetical protein
MASRLASSATDGPPLGSARRGATADRSAMSARNFGQSHAIDRSCVAFGSGAAVMLGLAIPALIYAVTRIGGAMYIDSHEEYCNNGLRARGGNRSALAGSSARANT